MGQTKSTWTRSPNIRCSHRWVIMQYIALLLLTASLGVPDKTGLIDYITDLRDYITVLALYFSVWLYHWFSFFTESADSVVELPCPCVCLSVCLCHRVHFFSRPLIGPEITWSVRGVQAPQKRKFFGDHPKKSFLGDPPRVFFVFF